jgi:Zn-dependent peptidase ImmA (M78 family)/transcriptional regulator with XRE-family HTH domain
MSRGIPVPITPSVLDWAISESGYSREEIADAIGVSIETLERWKSGDPKPTLTQARRLAAKLHRPLASFLLPSPPPSRPLPVEFRKPIGQQRELSPKERRHVRRAARLQEILSWVATELSMSLSKTPSASLSESPVSVAQRARDLIDVSTSSQMDWPSSSSAFDNWRAALESTGHIVFLFSLGKDSCRGFSIWDDYAPVVAINTAWNEEARIFTLFHEFGHLITRTSSACVESIRTSANADPVERWCERFAADLLMPSSAIEASLVQYGWRPGDSITSLSLASRIARRFKVSLRAAVIRLIELGTATWNLYDDIPPISDKKGEGGGGGGRKRAQIREDQFGSRATSLLVRAVEKDVLSRSQAIDFLDIPDAAFDDLTRTVLRGD